MEMTINSLVNELANPQCKAEINLFVKNDLAKYLEDLDLLVKEISRSKLSIENEKNLRLRTINNGIVTKGEKLLEKVGDKVFQKRFREYFRKLRPEIFYSSEIMDKGFKKPRNYPGDFEMMNYVYNNTICSKTKLGQYFDNYFLQNAYSESVRGRKNKMVGILLKYINGFEGKTLSILNLPCGPARDVKELVESGKVRKDIPINIVCIDQDLDALTFAKNSIENKAKNIKIEFRQGDILNYVRHPKKYIGELGEFDLVYSIGLADYLPDKMLANMINFSWGLTTPRGEIIYAFKIQNKDPYAPLPPKWFCDWLFVPRSEEDALSVISKSKIENYEILKSEWEETGKIVFYTISKK